MTSYLILIKQDDDTWREIEKVQAPSGAEAIRRHGKEGTFAAVPARSWTVRSAEPITVTRLKVS